ncbi:MAG TPA: PH domain-containing protein [Kineosporiaceae bacterium]
MTPQSEVRSEPGPGVRPGGEPFDPVGVRWNRVSTKLAAARRLTGLLALAVPGALLVVPAVLIGSWWWLAPMVPVAVGAWWWWVAGRQVAAIGYAERDDDLLVRRGIMWRYIVVVPYGRLQYVDVQAGPVDRIFGIARVQLHTASAATDAMIPGLPPAEAARVRDRLAARGQARLAGL